MGSARSKAPECLGLKKVRADDVTSLVPRLAGKG